MPRPAFTVVSSTVGALVVLGFASLLIKPKIPKPEGNELSQDSSEFLSRAAIQQVKWNKPIASSFALARRRDRPILLFVGNTYNPMARGFDRAIQLSPRIQALLARNFECIRVDSLAFPQFRNAYLPLSRSFANVQPGCQLWVLDPSGKIVDLLPSQLGLNPGNENALIDALVEAKQKFERMAVDPTLARFETAQQKDLELLQSSQTTIAPPFLEYAAAIQTLVSPKGGFQGAGPRSLTPEAWRYLLATGQLESFKTSISPVLQSPIVDLIDGGFFQGSRDSEWIEVDFDKSALSNAAMLRMLALANAAQPDPLFAYLANRTYRCLLESFVTPTGFAAARPSDSEVGQRSQRSSISVRRLRESLQGPDHDWAQDFLGLRVETNPLMAPRLAKLEATQDLARLNNILNELTNDLPNPPACGSIGFADVTAFCVARMIEAARLTKNVAQVDEASKLFDLVEANRQGTDIAHHPNEEWAIAYVGDYLAYADVALEHYLATGRFGSIVSGRNVLLRALALFADSELQSLALGFSPKSPLPPSLASPEISDSGFDGAVSYAIRLCYRYSCIFDSEPKFKQFANRATGKFGSIAPMLSIRGAAFFTAAQELFEGACFVTVGKDAQRQADDLAVRQPFRLVFPAFGDIRPDIRSKGAGVYFVRGDRIEGPMTVDRAAKAISPFLGKSN